MTDDAPTAPAHVTADDLRALVARYGTQEDVARDLGVALRTIHAACADETYSRRRLYYYAVRGLLAE